MAAKFVVLCALVALTAGARLRREEKSAAAGILEDLQKHAGEFQKTFSDQINLLANSKNTQEFNKALKEGSNSVLQQLSSFSNTLQTVVNEANGRTKEVAEQSRDTIQRTIEDLRRQHPEVEQKAQQLRTTLQDAVKKTAEETQKLAKEVAQNMEQTNQKLAPKIKEAYDDFVKQAEAVQKQLHEAATKQ